jgi:hypothetical protein
MAVRSLIGDESRWTKGALSRGEDNRKVSITHPHATKFSLEGAFYRIQYITQARCGPAHSLVRQALDPKGLVSMEAFNNALGTTHWTVTQKLDSVIRSLGGTPPAMEEEE